jgi:hypothetical protein
MEVKRIKKIKERNVSFMEKTVNREGKSFLSLLLLV